MVISIEDNKEYSLATLEDRKVFIFSQTGSRIYQCYILMDDDDQRAFLTLCSEQEQKKLWESAWKYAAEQGTYEEKLEEFDRQYGNGAFSMLAALRLIRQA